MNKNKKIAIGIGTLFAALSFAACGQVKEDELAAIQQESSMQVSEKTDSEINEDKITNTENADSEVNEDKIANTESADSEINGDEIVNTESTDSETQKDEAIITESPSVNQQESSTQTVENTDLKMTSEELLNLFINGSIDAVDSADSTSAFYITDLNMDSEKSDSYSVGEMVDLDNDGENELIICGPYGGIYLDARDNKVYEFARGDGDANILSYTYYNGEIWIMYDNSKNTDCETYHMEKYEGADNMVAEMSFSEELVDENNLESGMKYVLNGKEISYDEYEAFCSKIFAAQESTN